VSGLGQSSKDDSREEIRGGIRPPLRTHRPGSLVEACHDAGRDLPGGRCPACGMNTWMHLSPPQKRWVVSESSAPHVWHLAIAFTLGVEWSPDETAYHVWNEPIAPARETVSAVHPVMSPGED
jgi:hypothetical protein